MCEKYFLVSLKEWWKKAISKVKRAVLVQHINLMGSWSLQRKSNLADFHSSGARPNNNTECWTDRWWIDILYYFDYLQKNMKHTTRCTLYFWKSCTSFSFLGFVLLSWSAETTTPCHNRNQPPNPNLNLSAVLVPKSNITFSHLKLWGAEKKCPHFSNMS